MLDHAQIEAFRENLEATKRDLTTLSENTEEERKPVALDQQSVGRLSRMDAMQNQAMQVETERRRRISLLRVDAALMRIKEDEFGFCAACGDELDLRRLEHDASVTTCIECARKSS